MQQDTSREIIRFEDRYYILANSSLTDSRTQVLKDNDIFAVFDRYGDLTSLGNKQLGLFFEGTRFLSQFELRLNSERPLLLSSTIKQDNTSLNVDLANPDYAIDGHILLPKDAIHISKTIFLFESTYYQSIKIRNYDLNTHKLNIVFKYAADFSDIFEVRGIEREKKGKHLPTVIKNKEATLQYLGLDSIYRQTHISFSEQPDKLLAGEACFHLELSSQEEKVIELKVSCITNPNCYLEFSTPMCSINGIPKNATELNNSNSNSFNQALSGINNKRTKALKENCEIYTSNEQFNDWLNRSQADLQMMLSDTSFGLYPYAGVPWFSTAFGRDGIISALHCLWLNPEIAKGVLKFLAYYQATELNIEQDAEPGKILHEIRKGEMASLKEIPFGLYYGSIDSTPLFLVLAGEYFERTNDLVFMNELWPSIEKALMWIDKYGDFDGDGFLEYSKHSLNGLIQQGWKDSHDSVFHSNGEIVQDSIVLSEVQGYVYAAKRGVANIAKALGKLDISETLLKQANKLRENFEKSFWNEELSCYVLALDSNKKQCKVKSSNAGQVLFSGIASEERALKTAQTLLKEDLFSGWGIRTISTSEVRYNPMSYHNGSIWPHDNAMIVSGFAKYNLRKQSLKVFTGLFDASIFMELNRLPELFCGFDKKIGEGPILYPVACSPQAWATTTVFSLLQSCLGLSFNHSAGKTQMKFTYPSLPSWLEEVQIKGLKVGNSQISFVLRRHNSIDVGLEVLEKTGEIEILILK